MSGVPWLVLPTFNEAENVEAVVTAARGVLAQAAPEGFRVLVVDDTSPDGTGEIADRLAAAHPGEVAVLHRTERQGLGPAYLAGFAHALGAGASHVLEMDCDFSHDPADVARLLDAVRSGADVALGSRYVAGGRVEDWGPLRRVVSRGGFKCFRREVLEGLDLPTVRSKGYAFQVELTYRAVRRGFRVVEVPIVFRDRRHGTSKMSARIAVEAMWRLPGLRRGGA